MNSPAKLPITAIASAVALIVGVGVGMLISGGDRSAPSGLPIAGTAAASNQDRATVIQPWREPDDTLLVGAGGTIAISMQDGGVQFEKFVRGALRLPDSIDRTVRLREIARSISISDLPAAIEVVARLPFSDRWETMKMLGSRWADSDPTAAADFGAKSLNGRYVENSFFSGVLEKWASMDVSAASGWINRQDAGRRSIFLRELVQAVARRDPEEALKLTTGVTDLAYAGEMHNEIIGQWCQRDPAAAAKSALQISDGISRERSLQAVASAWALADPVAARTWVESIADKSAQSILMRRIAETWAENDPQAVVDWARALTDPILRQDLFATGINYLAARDTAAAFEVLRAFPAGQERDNMVVRAAMGAAGLVGMKEAQRFIDLLPEGSARAEVTLKFASGSARTEPRIAADLFGALPREKKSEYLRYFARSLTYGDAAFAREWASELEDKAQRREAMSGVASSISEVDPRAAAAWLVEKDPTADASEILIRWADRSPRDVLDWSKDLPEGEVRRAAGRVVVHQLVEKDLEQAREVFSRDLSPDVQAATAEQLTRGWAKREIPAARAWAEALPPGGIRENALAGLAGAWAQQDSAAAAQWLQGFAPGDERDRVVTQFAGAVIDRDPPGALEWAASIADPQLRSAQLEQHVSRWLQQDPAAAREWITKTDQLTPNARRRLLE